MCFQYLLNERSVETRTFLDSYARILGLLARARRTMSSQHAKDDWMFACTDELHNRSCGNCVKATDRSLHASVTFCCRHESFPHLHVSHRELIVVTGMVAALWASAALPVAVCLARLPSLSSFALLQQIFPRPRQLLVHTTASSVCTVALPNDKYTCIDTLIALHTYT